MVQICFIPNSHSSPLPCSVKYIAIFFHPLYNLSTGHCHARVHIKWGITIKKCFIVCPIGQESTDTRKRSDTLLNFILKPVCNECGFEVIRVDESNTGDSITQNIIEHLTHDDLVIADLSEQNPNAFYELGYRTALGKPTIQIKSKGEPLPFDVSSIQTFDYDVTDIPDTEIFKQRIKKTIESFNFQTQG